MLKRISAVVIMVLLVACGDKADNTIGTSPSQNPPSAQQPFPKRSNPTAVEWNNAIKQAFDKVNSKKLYDKKNPEYVIDEGTVDINGVSEFLACFDKEPPKCKINASGERDEFRKIQFFRVARLKFGEATAIKSFVSAYVSLKDCGEPKIILQPTFRGEKWIFFEQFALMLDGIIVIDRKFETGDIDRDNSHNGVTESAHIVLTKQEVEALSKISEAKHVLVRLSGKKGYVGLTKYDTWQFTQGITDILKVHDALGGAIKGVSNVEDTTCPL